MKKMTATIEVLRNFKKHRAALIVSELAASLLFLVLTFSSSYAEVIDGPANVRFSPKGKIILSLKNEVPVKVVSTQAEWYLINVHAVFDKGSLSAEGKIRKGVILYDERGSEIGEVLDEIEIKKKSEKNGKYVAVIAGYTYKENVIAGSIDPDKKSKTKSSSILSLPLGLSGEEYLLKGKPSIDDGDGPPFTPVESSTEEIFKKHQKERNNPLVETDSASIGKDKLKAELVIADDGRGEKIAVRLNRNGVEIFSVLTGDFSAVEPIGGLWSYRKHWILEVAHTKNKEVIKDKAHVVYTDVNGEIIQDGESINKRYGYQESFGFQLMNGKPFYFFKKYGRIGISFNGQEILLGYDDVPHYQCCSSSVLNPRVNKNMVSFYAQRDGKWYYVEIGVF